MHSESKDLSLRLLNELNKPILPLPLRFLIHLAKPSLRSYRISSSSTTLSTPIVQFLEYACKTL